MSEDTLAVVGFALVVLGAIASIAPLHRGSGLFAGGAALACAAVVAETDARWALRPESWLLFVALSLAGLAQALRVQRVRRSQQQSGVR